MNDFDHFMIKDAQKSSVKQKITNYVRLFYAQGCQQSWNAKHKLMSNNHHYFQIHAFNEVWSPQVVITSMSNISCSRMRTKTEILSGEWSKHVMLILRSRLYAREMLSINCQLIRSIHTVEFKKHKSFCKTHKGTSKISCSRIEATT